MKNSIDARVEFSFKGKEYDLVSCIDLDVHNSLSSIHEILARDHHIDTISYLYEVMLETEIEFSNAQGFAADFLIDEYFDQDAFNKHWQEHKIVLLLQPIANRELNIADLNKETALKHALIQAYKLGQGL